MWNSPQYRSYSKQTGLCLNGTSISKDNIMILMYAICWYEMLEHKPVHTIAKIQPKTKIELHYSDNVSVGLDLSARAIAYTAPASVQTDLWFLE